MNLIAVRISVINRTCFHSSNNNNNNNNYYYYYYKHVPESATCSGDADSKPLMLLFLTWCLCVCVFFKFLCVVLRVRFYIINIIYCLLLNPKCHRGGDQIKSIKISLKIELLPLVFHRRLFCVHDDNSSSSNQSWYVVEEEITQPTSNLDEYNGEKIQKIKKKKGKSA